MCCVTCIKIYMICFICTTHIHTLLTMSKKTGCLIMLMPPYMTLAPAHPLWLTTMDPWGQTFVFVTKSCHSNKTIGDEGITVEFWIIKVHTSN